LVSSSFALVDIVGGPFYIWTVGFGVLIIAASKFITGSDFSTVNHLITATKVPIKKFGKTIHSKHPM
jgi:hypothetical protein